MMLFSPSLNLCVVSRLITVIIIAFDVGDDFLDIIPSQSLPVVPPSLSS